MSLIEKALPDLPDLNALPPMDIARRAGRLVELLDGAGCDALLVTHLVNVRYLTGFTGSAGILLVRPDGLVFVTDGRYRDQSAEQLAAAGVEARIEISNNDQKALLQAAVAGVTRLGLEAEHVTWGQQRRYADDWFADAELVATGGLVEGLRLVKDGGEVARIEAASLVADHALAGVRPLLGGRPTEQEFALALDTAIRRLGAAGNSFETIVGSGPNGAKPHARPTGRRITGGDLVVIDFGALVDGYCSDMTRTLIVGAPSATQQRMLDVVTAAQQAGVDALRPGVGAKDVDAACRQVIAEAGWADAFLHGTGHGVGLDIHEQPRVASTADATLAAGQVVTVEPGVYLPEHGGVRVEDTLVITAEGARALTHTAKGPAVQPSDRNTRK
jgi:Xaa-Pro aminopeptidase